MPPKPRIPAGPSPPIPDPRQPFPPPPAPRPLSTANAPPIIPIYLPLSHRSFPDVLEALLCGANYPPLLARYEISILYTLVRGLTQNLPPQSDLLPPFKLLAPAPSHLDFYRRGSPPITSHRPSSIEDVVVALQNTDNLFPESLLPLASLYLQKPLNVAGGPDQLAKSYSVKEDDLPDFLVEVLPPSTFLPPEDDMTRDRSPLVFKTPEGSYTPSPWYPGVSQWSHYFFKVDLTLQQFQLVTPSPSYLPDPFEPLDIDSTPLPRADDVFAKMYELKDEFDRKCQELEECRNFLTDKGLELPLAAKVRLGKELRVVNFPKTTIKSDPLQAIDALKELASIFDQTKNGSFNPADRKPSTMDEALHFEKEWNEQGPEGYFGIPKTVNINDRSRYIVQGAGPTPDNVYRFDRMNPDRLEGEETNESIFAASPFACGLEVAAAGGYISQVPGLPNGSKCLDAFAYIMKHCDRVIASLYTVAPSLSTLLAAPFMYEWAETPGAKFILFCDHDAAGHLRSIVERANADFKAHLESKNIVDAVNDRIYIQCKITDGFSKVHSKEITGVSRDRGTLFVFVGSANLSRTGMTEGSVEEAGQESRVPLLASHETAILQFLPVGSFAADGVLREHRRAHAYLLESGHLCPVTDRSAPPFFLASYLQEFDRQVVLMKKLMHQHLKHVVAPPNLRECIQPIQEDILKHFGQPLPSSTVSLMSALTPAEIQLGLFLPVDENGQIIVISKLIKSQKTPTTNEPDVHVGVLCLVCLCWHDTHLPQSCWYSKDHPVSHGSFAATETRCRGKGGRKIPAHKRLVITMAELRMRNAAGKTLQLEITEKFASLITYGPNGVRSPYWLLNWYETFVKSDLVGWRTVRASMCSFLEQFEKDQDIVAHVQPFVSYLQSMTSNNCPQWILAEFGGKIYASVPHAAADKTTLKANIPDAFTQVYQKQDRPTGNESRKARASTDVADLDELEDDEPQGGP